MSVDMRGIDRRAEKRPRYDTAFLINGHRRKARSRRSSSASASTPQSWSPARSATNGAAKFTVIGDAVNIASRLQDLTRTLEREALISGGGLPKACNAMPCRRTRSTRGDGTVRSGCGQRRRRRIWQGCSARRRHSEQTSQKAGIPPSSYRQDRAKSLDAGVQRTDLTAESTLSGRSGTRLLKGQRV